MEQSHDTVTTSTWPPKGSRNNIEQAVQIKGEIQGKSDVASLLAMTGNTLLKAYGKFYKGIQFPSVCGKEHGTRKNNDAYADNVDTWAGLFSNESDAADEVMY